MSDTPSPSPHPLPPTPSNNTPTNTPIDSKSAAIKHVLLSSGCSFNTMYQYSCQDHSYKISCRPFKRVFLQCPGKPAVEVTPKYDEKGNQVSDYVFPDFITGDDIPRSLFGIKKNSMFQ